MTEQNPVEPVEINGIPTFIAPRIGARGAAGLVFRVGRADETFATAGITHLVEHLALHHHGVGELHFNGATGDVVTSFVVEGDTSELVEYLNGVCSSLRDLPMERMAVECEILRTEARGRGQAPAASLPIYRYGAQGYGLSSYDEFGLNRLDAQTVRDWAQTHFTRGNAALWLATDEPLEGLDLTLPDGPRLPCPAATNELPKTPAWFFQPGNYVVIDSVVERSSTANVFTQLLSRALFTELRQQAGISYNTQADYYPRDGHYARLTAWADGPPEKLGAAVGGMIDVLARLKWGTVTEAELDNARRRTMHHLDDPEANSRLLPSLAVNLLLGYPNQTLAELRRDVEAVTVDDIRQIAEQFHSTALTQTPVGNLDWAGFTQAPQSSSRQLFGQPVVSKEPEAPALILSSEGLGVGDEAKQINVAFADVVGVLCFPDGARTMFGRDGFSLRVEPTMHDLPRPIESLVDANVPPETLIPMPAREPEAIPKPPTAAELKQRAKREPKSASTRDKVVFGATVAFAVFWLIATLAVSAKAGPDDNGVVGKMWIVGLFIGGFVRAMWPKRSK